MKGGVKKRERQKKGNKKGREEVFDCPGERGMNKQGREKGVEKENKQREMSSALRILMQQWPKQRVQR